jgi:hypothetical protein
MICSLDIRSGRRYKDILDVVGQTCFREPFREWSMGLVIIIGLEEIREGVFSPWNTRV